ncbi:response regulator [Thermodesulfobacteriota bacterium]
MSPGEKPNATILVIDDEQIVHDSVQRILENEGYDVDGALRVAEALEMLAKKSYDLVLTDLMMPDESGMKAVEAVARDHPYCGVVMFTGFATVESALESMKLGALDYLPKPFTPEELIDVAGKALSKTLKARRDREIEGAYTEAESAVRSSLDLKEILNLICSSVIRLLKVRGTCLYMYKKKDEVLDPVAWKGLSPEYLDKGLLGANESAPEVLKTGDPILVEEADFDSRLQYPDQARKEGIVGILTVPLKVQETILGVLRIYSSEAKSFEQVEMDILLKFAEQAARALENAMAFEKVRDDIESLKKQAPQVFVGDK